MNLPDYLYKRVSEEFNRRIEDVFRDMLDVMSGNKQGNQFEREFTRRVYESYLKQKEEENQGGLRHEN